ncbi:other/FunK1 protein kinase, variant 2 [Coprinopsis cinerea AmutBmut pab1-1]|nr:other/FunK1 protein kinase, variant 2 [Coprinopsis cinerea AmutBmut pab1-1]
MIHGTELSLWCISRSHAVKSIPISILEHSDLLIRALVSLTSAAEDQLGFDPLINLLPDGSYVYTLPPDDLRTTPLFYHTLVLVSQFHSSSPGGRTSRIWKVRQVASPTDPSPIPGTANMILKDATLDARLPTEADNQRQLFADIADIAKNEKWRSHPIVKEFHARDLALLFDAFQGENFKRYFACITASHVAKPCTVAGGDLSPDSPNPARRRCFFICDSICTPLYDIPTLGDAMDVLIQSLTALQLMFCAGWVHRDVSAGNILAVQSSPADPWRVKLSDLEYARRFPVEGAVEDAQKTGTPYFMACELLSLSNFLPDIRRRGGHRPIYPKKPVIHNYQHDLEAIWWIALWLICMRINQPLPRSFGNEHFQHNVGRTYSDIRSCLFADPFSLGSYSSLTQSLPPPLRSTFLSSLDALRNNLYVEYVSRNKEGKQDDPGTYSWIASEGFTLFIESIRGCRDEWAKIPLMVESKLRLQRQRQVRPPPPPPPPPAKKRKSEDDGQSQSMGETQLEDQRRPKKKVRATPQAPPQRSGPVTRSMTRRQTTTGPLTRAASRRLQELKGKGASSRPIVGSAVRKTCR